MMGTKAESTIQGFFVAINIFHFHPFHQATRQTIRSRAFIDMTFIYVFYILKSYSILNLRNLKVIRREIALNAKFEVETAFPGNSYYLPLEPIQSFPFRPSSFVADAPALH